ncbi:MAG: apolipoprotein N-acyltransferase [Candidatus Sumerlaeaceae bacterium]
MSASPPRDSATTEQRWRTFVAEAAVWNLPARYFWGGCILSGLLGGPTFAHVVRGIRWDAGSAQAIPVFALGSWPLAWIALAPFFMALCGERSRRWVSGTLVFGFLWHFTSLVWLATLIPFNPFIPLGVVLLPLAQAGFTLIFAAVARRLFRQSSSVMWPAILATTWVGVEYARTLGPFAFPWNFLGHSQALGNAWACQVADLSGGSTVSWPIAYLNATLALTLLRLLQKGHKGLPSPHSTPVQLRVPVVIAGALLLFQFGFYPLLFPKCKAESRDLHVAALQANIAQVEKMRFYAAPDPDVANLLDYEMTSRTLSLIARACTATSNPLDLLVLPESAFNSNYFVYDRVLHKELELLSRTCRADILFGADRREPATSYTARLASPFSGTFSRPLPALEICMAADGTTYPCERQPMVSTVSAFFVRSETGLTSTVYDKIHLVPFGETAPILDKIPYFQEWILMVGTYARGTEYTIFRSHETNFGVMICFESTFAELARSYARRGAQLICIITNDGWYDPSHLRSHEDFWRSPDTDGSAGSRLALFWSTAWRRAFSLPPLAVFLNRGPIQHFAHAVLRAIETRRPVLRVANTGISALVTPEGIVRQWLPWRHEGVLFATIRICSSPPETLAVRFGDWWGVCCFLVVVAGVLLQIRDLFRARRLQPDRSSS